MIKNNDDVALAGSTALIVFIALVLVAAIAATVILDVGGVLEQQAGQTGTDASDQLSSQLNVLSTVGEIDEDGDAIEEVSMTVASSPGADDLNLADVTIEVVSSNGGETLTVGSEDEDEEEDELVGYDASASDAEFGVEEISSDSDFGLITSPDDRHQLIIELEEDEGALDLLEEGESVELSVVTGPGGQTFESFTVPTTISDDEETVSL